MSEWRRERGMLSVWRCVFPDLRVPSVRPCFMALFTAPAFCIRPDSLLQGSAHLVNPRFKPQAGSAGLKHSASPHLKRKNVYHASDSSLIGSRSNLIFQTLPFSLQSNICTLLFHSAIDQELDLFCF